MISIGFRAAGTPGARSAILHITHTTPGPPLNVKLAADVKK